ncbi:phage tail protein [Nocardia sp. NPDC052566]|uniref:phage tail protein n=1 Tax=Nocardia sp. NPDC052566 TaxID=3364330 RepID=UPI0037C6BA86
MNTDVTISVTVDEAPAEPIIEIEHVAIDPALASPIEGAAGEVLILVPDTPSAGAVSLRRSAAASGAFADWFAGAVRGDTDVQPKNVTIVIDRGQGAQATQIALRGAFPFDWSEPDEIDGGQLVTLYFDDIDLG